MAEQHTNDSISSGSMKPRFTTRSLLYFTLFLAAVASTLCLDRSRTSCSSSCILLQVGGILFWMTLLAPFWVFKFFFTPEDRRRSKVRPTLALIPAGWYCALYFFAIYWPESNVPPRDSWRAKLIVLTGTIISCWVLLLPRCRLWYVVVAPLAFAILSGTAWLVLAR